MNPEVLTLENIFNMDLARYKDTCLEIVANSVKELSIERSINDVEKVSIYFTLLSTPKINFECRKMYEATNAIIHKIFKIY